MIKLITIITLIAVFPTLASAEYKVQYTKAGEAAAFEGFLISLETEKQFRITDMELNYQKTLNASLESINKSYQNQTDIMQQRITNLQDANNKLSDQVASSNSMLSKVGMFVLGAATATLIAYAASRAVR